MHPHCTSSIRIRLDLSVKKFRFRKIKYTQWFFVELHAGRRWNIVSKSTRQQHELSGGTPVHIYYWELKCSRADASSWAWRRARLASALSAIAAVVVRLQVEECLCRVFDMLQLKELCAVNQTFTVSNLLALSLFFVWQKIAKNSRASP